MAERAIEGVRSFEVCSREAGDDPSYTVDTLRWASSAFPGAELFLLIGGDSLSELDTWRAPEEIRSRATLAVYEREGHAPPPPSMPHVRIQGPLVHVSSTAIRARVRDGRPIRFWVPRAVAEYIEAEGLYAGASS
jgi:nicotinate-nucleotide adenylyltransferase